MLVTMTICLFTTAIVGFMLHSEYRKATPMNDAKLTILMGSNRHLPYAESNSTRITESFLSMVLGQLVYASGAFEVEPGLVSEWTFDGKSQEYQLTLRSDVKFQNGRKATSADLEFSLVRHLLGEYGSWFRSFFSNIDGVSEVKGLQAYRPGLVKGIRVIDSRRIAIRLLRPNPSFMHSLARSTFSLVPREELKEDGSTWIRWPIGAGPYAITDVDIENGTVELAGAVSVVGGRSPKKITVLMNGDSSVADISLLGPNALANEVARLELPSFVTLLNFNFTSKRMRDGTIRAAIRQAIHPDKLGYDHLELSPTDQLLPRHFWGRATEISTGLVTASRARIPLNIIVFDSGSNSPNFFSFVAGIEDQLRASNFEPKVRFTGNKYSNPPKEEQNDIEISSLGADVMDPLVIFSAFRPGSPLAPYIPDMDGALETLFYRAADAIDQDSREKTVTALSNYFESRNYTVPLFERYSTVAFNPRTIASLGRQNGSLILYTERVEIK